jgi:hypothetical protein
MTDRRKFHAGSWLGQVGKKHGYKMIPTIKGLGKAFGLVVKDQIMKLTPVKHSNQLTKQTRMSYHRTASLLLAIGFSLLLNHALQLTFHCDGPHPSDSFLMGLSSEPVKLFLLL